MTAKVQYYAIVGRSRTSRDPSGLARRRSVDGNSVDESLRRDLTWADTTAIAESDRGEELARELVEVSEDEAEALVERFREKWGVEG